MNRKATFAKKKIFKKYDNIKWEASEKSHRNVSKVKKLIKNSSF